MPTGTATLTFGAFPGSSHATLAVTGQAGLLGASSKVEAWLQPATTADHSPDEHVAETLNVVASDIVDGGFTIHGTNHGYGDTMLYGAWNVAWVWA